MSINESANQALLGLKKDLEEDEKNGRGSKWEEIEEGIDFGKKNNSFRLNIGHSFESGDGKKYTVESIKSMGDLVVASLDVDGKGTVDVAIVGGEIKGDVLELVLTDPDSGDDLGTITIDRNISKGKPPLVTANPDATISKDKKDDIINKDDDEKIKTMTSPAAPGGAPKKVEKKITPKTKSELLDIGVPEKEIENLTEKDAKEKLANVKAGIEDSLTKRPDPKKPDDGLIEKKYLERISSEYIKLIDDGASDEDLKKFIKNQSFIIEKDKKGARGKKVEKSLDELETELIRHFYNKSKGDLKKILQERRRLHEEKKLKKVDQDYIDEVNTWLTNFEKSKNVPGLDAHSVAVFDITIEKLKQLKIRLEKGEKIPKTELGDIYDEHNKGLKTAPSSLDKEAQDKLDAINTLIMEFIDKKKFLDPTDERNENINQALDKFKELRTKIENGERVEGSEIESVRTEYEASLVEPAEPTILKPEEERIMDEKFASIGLSREEITNNIPEFLELSYGQQLLAIDNFNQRIVQQAALEARNQFAQEINDKEKNGFFGRLWKGMNKSFFVAKYENQALKKNLTLGTEAKKDILKDLVGQINTVGYNVEGNQFGSYQIKFVEETAPAGSALENSINGLNISTTNFSKIPIEWSYKEATKDQQKKFQESKNKFANDLMRYEQELILSGMSEKDAMIKVAQLNTEVWGLQALRSHENSDEEVSRMKSNRNYWNILKQSVKSGISEKAGYFTAGFGARMVTSSIFGLAAVPLVAAGFSGWRSGKRAQESLNDLTKRMRAGYKTGEQQLVETYKNAQLKLSELNKIENPTPEQIGEMSQLREESEIAQSKLFELRNKGTINGQMSMELEKERIKYLNTLRETEEKVQLAGKIPQEIFDAKNARWGRIKDTNGNSFTFSGALASYIKQNPEKFSKSELKDIEKLISDYQKVQEVEERMDDIRIGGERSINKLFNKENKIFGLEDVRNRQIVDAKTWIGNFNNMFIKLESLAMQAQFGGYKERVKYETMVAKLGTRVKYIQEAIREGNMNLGGQTEQLKNITELTTLLTRAKATFEMGKKDSDAFKDYNERFDDIQYRLEQAGDFDKVRQNNRLWQQRMKGAVIGFTIASAGIGARQAIEMMSGNEIDVEEVKEDIKADIEEVEKENVPDESNEQSQPKNYDDSLKRRPFSDSGDKDFESRGRAPSYGEDEPSDEESIVDGSKEEEKIIDDGNKEDEIVPKEQDGEFINNDFKLEVSSKGAIQTMLDAKAKLAEMYEDVPDEKIPPAYKHILETPARKLAQEIGHYRPDDEAESISMLKGSTLEFKDGEVISNSLKNINGEFESEKLFDSEGNLVEGGEDNERFFDYKGRSATLEDPLSANTSENVIDDTYDDTTQINGEGGGAGAGENGAGTGEGSTGNEGEAGRNDVVAGDAEKKEMTKKMLRKTRRVWRKGARGLGRMVYETGGGYGSSNNGVELGENYYEGGNKFYGAGRTASYEQNTGGLPTGTSIMNPGNPSYSSQNGWGNFFDNQFYVGGSGRGKFWAAWREIKNNLASEQFNDRYFLQNHATDKNIGIYEYINKIAKEIGRPKDDETVEEYIARGIKAGVKRPKVIR